VERRAHEHDIVELTETLGAWPAGTVGAVVSTYPSSALVEVASGAADADLFGELLLSAPYEVLRVVEPPVRPDPAQGLSGKRKGCAR